MSADVVFLEEAAFVKPKTFFVLIAPLLTIDKTVWLNISTPSYDRFNHFNRMMKNSNMKTLDIQVRGTPSMTGLARVRKAD